MPHSASRFLCAVVALLFLFTGCKPAPAVSSPVPDVTLQATSTPPQSTQTPPVEKDTDLFIQADTLDEAMHLFGNMPYPARLFSEHDIPGDDAGVIAQTYFDRTTNTPVILLANGETLVLEPDDDYQFAPWYTLACADVTGDGNNDIFAFVDMGSVGGDGGFYPILFVAQEDGSFLSMPLSSKAAIDMLVVTFGKMPTFYDGIVTEVFECTEEEIFARYETTFQLDAEEQAYLRESGYIEGSPDFVSNYMYAECGGKTYLLLRYYVSGAYGHADHLGYWVEALSFSPEGEATVENACFVLPQ